MKHTIFLDSPLFQESRFFSNFCQFFWHAPTTMKMIKRAFLINFFYFFFLSSQWIQHVQLSTTDDYYDPDRLFILSNFVTSISHKKINAGILRHSETQKYIELRADHLFISSDWNGSKYRFCFSLIFFFRYHRISCCFSSLKPTSTVLKRKKNCSLDECSAELDLENSSFEC